MLTTARLRLRPFEDRDLEDLWPLVSDPELPRMIGRLEDDVWRDGRWWPMLRYELTAGEWSDASTTMRVTRPPPG